MPFRPTSQLLSDSRAFASELLIDRLQQIFTCNHQETAENQLHGLYPLSIMCFAENQKPGRLRRRIQLAKIKRARKKKTPHSVSNPPIFPIHPPSFSSTRIHNKTSPLLSKPMPPKKKKDHSSDSTTSSGK